MRVFVAGATGAIGQPLIAELVRQGHTVTGMTHSEAGAQPISLNRKRARQPEKTQYTAAQSFAVPQTEKQQRFSISGPVVCNG